MKTERSAHEVESIADVWLDGSAQRASEHRRFYTEYLGLVEVEHPPVPEGGPAVLCFEGQRNRVCIKSWERPVVDTVPVRAVIAVKSLDALRQILEDNRVMYFSLRGVGGLSHRLQVLDPEGNRLEVRESQLF